MGHRARNIPFLASGPRFLPEAPTPRLAGLVRQDRGVIRPVSRDDAQSLLTVAQAATLLGVHPNTIRTWTDAGRLTAYRINARGDRRFRRGDVERLLAEGAASEETAA